MIRSATISDIEPIAKALWTIWHHLKARQIGSPLRSYSSPEILADKIRQDLNQWLVCDSSAPEQTGFFELSNLGEDKTYKRFRFPKTAIKIDHFACLLSGEILLQQFQLLASRFPDQSILVCISSQLRDACWAALKAGFGMLGESPLIVGTYMWLYLDRENKHEEIQTKLRRAKILVA